MEVALNLSQESFEEKKRPLHTVSFAKNLRDAREGEKVLTNAERHRHTEKKKRWID